jgi:DNA repair protein RadC
LTGGIAEGFAHRAEADKPPIQARTEYAPWASIMRVYEAELVYHLVSLGDDVALDTPEKAVEYLQSLYSKNPVQEAFCVIALDRKNRPIARHLVTLGTLTASLVAPRETFRFAIMANAAAIICSHNHPSGSPQPSSADIAVTRRLCQAAESLDIGFHDHIIVGDRESDPGKLGYYSFRQAGLC